MADRTSEELSHPEGHDRFFEAAARVLFERLVDAVKAYPPLPADAPVSDLRTREECNIHYGAALYAKSLGMDDWAAVEYDAYNACLDDL